MLVPGNQYQEVMWNLILASWGLNCYVVPTIKIRKSQWEQFTSGVDWSPLLRIGPYSKENLREDARPDKEIPWSFLLKCKS
jgi:hypothetical protein